jgi:vacuolar protein sorting-associated protein 26C
MASLEIRLKRANRVYSPGEMVSGVVVVKSKSKLDHKGVSLSIQGAVQLQLSAKSVGLFEAFYNSLKPIELLNYSATIAKPGKIPAGSTELPFEFELKPSSSAKKLYETYHGVFVTVQYNLVVEMKKNRLWGENVSQKLEFIVETKSGNPPKSEPVPFTIRPEDLDNVKKRAIKRIPPFELTGQLTSAVCHINKPFTGSVVVKRSDTPIKSIELQLVRVETCGCAEGYAKEATEIQNIQIAEGDICRGLEIPIYMVFPRLFTCTTIATRTFKIEFEVNLVLMLENGALISENFPIILVRG